MNENRYTHMTTDAIHEEMRRMRDKYRQPGSNVIAAYELYDAKNELARRGISLP